MLHFDRKVAMATIFGCLLMGIHTMGESTTKPTKIQDSLVPKEDVKPSTSTQNPHSSGISSTLPAQMVKDNHKGVIKIDEPQKELYLPPNDPQLPMLVDIARCRVVCPSECWQQCHDVRNDLSTCAKQSLLPSNQSNRNRGMSLPCTMYARRPPDVRQELVCPDFQRWSLVNMTVLYEDTTAHLVLNWELTNGSSESFDHDVIIVLFWRDTNQTTWLYLNMYLRHNIRIPVEEPIYNFVNLDLLLVALDENCVLASAPIYIPNQVLHGPYTGVPFSVSHSTSRDDLVQDSGSDDNISVHRTAVNSQDRNNYHTPNQAQAQGQGQQEMQEQIKVVDHEFMADQDVVVTPLPSHIVVTPNSRDDNRNRIDVSVDVTLNDDGTLSVQVTWYLPQYLIGSQINLVNDVYWARDSCQANKSFPGCKGADRLKHSVVTGTPPDAMEEHLMLTEKSNMTLNSAYWVQVKVSSSQSPRKVISLQSPRINFTTPGCQYPNSAYTRCLPRALCNKNNSCQINRSATDFLSWEINLTCWQADLDRSGKEVKVFLAWHEPLTEGTVIGYHVWYHYQEALEDQSTFTESEGNVMELVLQTDRVYTIQVLAVSKVKGREKEGKPSMPVDFNTTLDALREFWPKCETFDNRGRSSPLVVSVAIIGGFLMAGLTILLIYKKRHSFREIIITKATVVKSNSYKSTLGYTDITDTKQLLSSQEDWEVDPLQVALGMELGEGAFGRVITGHYEGNKVAIKILKDGAPFFQREDLLREILLLKNLGSHAHIVSFVGACTRREPLALLMEYMPFGSLQNFLKRFRREGDLGESHDGYTLEYAFVDEMGVSEKWSLSPRDFLSFARQITMAMEYMAGRQYVHRDLAARNVLVGPNKNVKLCDFGLARLVYSEDQYYRLTGGRLPIRWMALESLRDRVYTSQSDVWAFGVLLWEIVTLGCCPYPDISLGELFAKLCDGYRMEQPKNCSHELYDIMSQCWCETPNDRPTFTHLRMQLENLLSQNMNYLVLDNISLSCDTSDASGDTAIFDISMESLVTEQDSVSLHSLDGADCHCNNPTSSPDGACSSQLHECLLHPPPEDSHGTQEVHSGHSKGYNQRGSWKHKGTNRSCRSKRSDNLQKTLSTWSVECDELKLRLRMHTLTKSTLSLADVQDSYSQLNRQNRGLPGSTNSEIHTISTLV